MRPQRKCRRSPRALRFADVKVGDVLIHRSKSRTVRYEHHERIQAPGRVLPFANDDGREVVEINHHAAFWVVEHRWFDPVAGQADPTAGEMVGVAGVTANGLAPRSYPHTLRGLASQGFTYASPEQAERVRAFIVERRDLLREFDAGLITPEAARLRATPYRHLVRDL